MSRRALRGDAWAFDRAAPDYDRGRPAYPAAAARHVATTLGLTPVSRVVEVGTGIGKFTRALAGAGGEVRAILAERPAAPVTLRYDVGVLTSRRH